MSVFWNNATLKTMKKLRKKSITLSASRGRRWLYYSLCCLGASLLVLACSLLDESLGTRLIGPLARLTLAWTAFSMARQSGLYRFQEEGPLLSPWLVMALLPLLMALVFYGGTGPFPGAEALFLTIFSALASALWEEVFFRFWGSILFEKEGRYRAWDFILMALLFALMHLTALVFAPPSQVMVQMVFALVSALFLQTLYALSHSLRLILLFHFGLNSITALSGLLCPKGAGLFFPELAALAPLILGGYFALSAALAARRKSLLIR